MADCLFCKIIKKEIPARIVYESREVLAFLDISPRAPGHTVVIPKTHAEDILALPQEELGDVFTAVQKVTALLLKALSPQGFTIGINHGKASGAEVGHLHIHIMPRWEDDGGGSIQSLVNNPSKESLDAIKEKILRG